MGLLLVLVVVAILTYSSLAYFAEREAQVTNILSKWQMTNIKKKPRTIWTAPAGLATSPTRKWTWWTTLVTPGPSLKHSGGRIKTQTVKRYLKNRNEKLKRHPKLIKSFVFKMLKSKKYRLELLTRMYKNKNKTKSDCDYVKSFLQVGSDDDHDGWQRSPSQDFVGQTDWRLLRPFWGHKQSYLFKNLKIWLDLEYPYGHQVFILTLPIPIVVNSFASFYKNRLWRNEVTCLLILMLYLHSYLSFYMILFTHTVLLVSTRL